MDRLEVIKTMHGIIVELGDEDIYMWWGSLMPAEPTEVEFDYFRDDIEFGELCKLFAVLVTFDRKYNN